MACVVETGMPSHAATDSTVALVVSAASGAPGVRAAFGSQSIRTGHKSIEQIAAEHRVRVKAPIRKGRRAVDLIRAERDAR